MIFTACLLHKSATFLQLFDTLICVSLYKLGKPVVRNRYGNFFRTLHLRAVIE